jgi:hypothetical protein
MCRIARANFLVERAVPVTYRRAVCSECVPTFSGGNCITGSSDSGSRDGMMACVDTRSRIMSCQCWAADLACKCMSEALLTDAANHCYTFAPILLQTKPSWYSFFSDSTRRRRFQNETSVKMSNFNIKRYVNYCSASANLAHIRKTNGFKVRRIKAPTTHEFHAAIGRKSMR